MKIIHLAEKIEHGITSGKRCPYIEPNINEDCILMAGDEIIGFYLNSLPEKAQKLADIADAEFRSDRVPKQLMTRTDVLRKQSDMNLDYRDARKIGTIQYSTILGSIPYKPIMRRYKHNYSSVHSNVKAKTFIKAMWLLAVECENIIKELAPNIYKRQVELLNKVPDKWKFANLFTSSISNFNISAPYHRDLGNIEGCVNVIVTKRKNSIGGCLNVPDYNLTFEQGDNSLLVYPAWMNIHGVTPIIPTSDGGYRNSLIFYPLKAFIGKEKE